MSHPSGPGDDSTLRRGHLNTRGDALQLYRALPAIPRRQAPVRRQLDSRGQARRLPAHGPARSGGIRLITRKGNDWTTRFPLVVKAVNHLRVRSCLIDGEVVCCDERGLARFDVLRRRRNEAVAFLYGFDLLELDGQDLRREPLRCARPRWPASCARLGRAAQ
jgi:hypothetical protein